MVADVKPSSQGNAPGEDTPLLPPTTSASPSPSRTLLDVTPLPLQQVLILCLIRVAEPIAFTLIFPFVVQQVSDSGVTHDPRKVGYYAGIIEALFALTTFCTVMAWGRLSDRIGRKPVLVFGLCGVFLSTIGFGLSQTFVAMVITRCLGGGLNGNVAVIKSMMSEITDSTNQAKAFSILPLSWSLGAVVGPIFGGFLSHPADNFPRLFGNSHFLRSHPYALPCFVGAIFPLVGAILTVVFLEESLKSRKPLLTLPASLSSAIEQRRHASFVSRTSTTVPVPAIETPTNGTVGEEEVVEGAPPFSALFTTAVRNALLVYAFLSLETVALDAVFILLSSTSTALGGLGLSSTSLGSALSFSGATTVLVQLLLFPRLQRRFGTVRLYKAFMSMWPAVFGMMPLMVWSARREEGEPRRMGMWITMGGFLVLKSSANMAYGCNMLNINAVSPSRRLLGTLNGSAQMVSSLMRALGPVGASSLYAYSLSSSSSSESFVWWVLVGVAVLGAGVARLLREQTDGWREREEREGVERA